MASHKGSSNYYQLKERIQLDSRHLQLLQGHISHKQSSIHFYKGNDLPKINMSRNKRFIAIGGGVNDHKINIVLKNKLKLIKSMRFNFCVGCFQFSQNDEQIYVEGFNQLYIQPFINCIQKIPYYDLSDYVDEDFIFIGNIQLFDDQIILSFGSKIISIDVCNHQIRSMIKVDYEICSFDCLYQINTLICSQQQQIISLHQNNQLVFKQKLQYAISDIKFYGNQSYFVGYYVHFMIMFIDYNKQQFSQIVTLIDEKTIELNYNLDLFPHYLIIYFKKNPYFFIYSLQADDQNPNDQLIGPSLCKLIKMKAVLTSHYTPKYIILAIK